MHDFKQIVSTFVAQQFPSAALVLKNPATATFEAICAEIFGTKQLRFGPMPSAEHQVHIRQIVRTALAFQRPIEFLVPWGSNKQSDSGLDILELSALRQLAGLRARISALYPPGVRITIRVEDATDMLLFSPEFNGKITDYRDTLIALIDGLGYDDFITVKPETTMLDFDHFSEHVAALAKPIATFIGARLSNSLTTPIESAMRKTGWQGNLSVEQLEYYTRSYRYFYPDLSDAERHHLLATYFACSLERRNLKATGAPQHPHIQLCFSLPVPGIPDSMAQNRLYYRTVPEHYTNCHKAPWIGRGHITVSNYNVCCIKLTSFDDSLITTPLTLTIGNAKVEAPYHLD